MVNNIAVQTNVTQQSITPDDAVQLLKAGNQRFLQRKIYERDLPAQVLLTATGQLSCIDSRVPVETVFDQGIGDLFSVRIAGNFVNEDILGSLEFACKVAGSKLVLVLGHTSCGAVKGACDKVVLGNLTGILDKINPAVRAVIDIQENRTSANPDFCAEGGCSECKKCHSGCSAAE